MTTINELPENILLELFSLVPARELLLRCRPVCSLWRDVIDLPSLWKRKCQREGFISDRWDRPVADWKIFYFLCSLKKNLIRNPCAEGGRETLLALGTEVVRAPGAVHGQMFCSLCRSAWAII
uniref:F-box protein 6 n=1 Tax=Ornithorhynchus anatinus TaxID=9258 RepID=A0A6I8N9S0_ORNAN